jgi:hypothetical protein
MVQVSGGVRDSRRVLLPSREIHREINGISAAQHLHAIAALNYRVWLAKQIPVLK